MNEDKIRDQYNALTASPALRKRISKMTKPRHLRWLKYLSGSVAALLVICIGSFNAVPALAAAAQDVPFLSTFVNVITFSRYEKKDNGMEAEIVTPKIEGLLDKTLEDKLNSQFVNEANTLIAAFEKDAADIKAQFGEDTQSHMNISADYEVKTDNADVLALDLYTFTTVGSSSTIHKFYNIDKKAEQVLTLGGLFKEGSDYMAVISEYIAGEMRRMNKDEAGMFFIDTEYEADNFKSIKPEQNFYINQDGKLVICFDKYEVAAGAQGSPEFALPTDIIAGITASTLIK